MKQQILDLLENRKQSEMAKVGVLFDDLKAEVSGIPDQDAGQMQAEMDQLRGSISDLQAQVSGLQNKIDQIRQLLG